MSRSSLVPPPLHLASPTASRAASSLPLERGPLVRYHALRFSSASAASCPSLFRPQFSLPVLAEHDGGLAWRGLLPWRNQLTTAAAPASLEAAAAAADVPVVVPTDVVVAGGAAVCGVHPLEGFLCKDSRSDQWLQLLRANCAGLPLPRLRLWGGSYREIIPRALPPPLQLSVLASFDGSKGATAQNREGRERSSVSLSTVTSLSVDQIKNELLEEHEGPPIPREVLLGLSWVRGVTHLLPVQQLVLPLLLQQETDVLLGASAGTGKTLAAATAVMTRLAREWNTADQARGGPPSKPLGALFLSPTRDTALQTVQMLRGLGRYTQLRVGLLVGRGPGEEGGGGAPWRCFSELQRQQPHVVVCTPGKAEELAQFLLAAEETQFEKTGKVQEGITDLLQGCMQLIVDDAGLQLQEPLMLRAIAKLKELMPPGHQCIMLSSSLSWELHSCAARLMRVGALCLNCLEGPPALTASCLLTRSDTSNVPLLPSSSQETAAAAAATAAAAAGAAAAPAGALAVQAHAAAAVGKVVSAAEGERAAGMHAKGETSSAALEVLRGPSCILDLQQPQVLWGPKRSREFLAKKRYEAARAMSEGGAPDHQAAFEVHGAPNQHGALDHARAFTEQVVSDKQGAPYELGASGEQGAPSEQGAPLSLCDHRLCEGARGGGLRSPEEFMLYPPELHGHVLFNVLAKEAEAAAAETKAAAAAATTTTTTTATAAAAAAATAAAAAGGGGAVERGERGAPFSRVLIFFSSTKSLQFHYALFKHFVIPNANRILQLPAALKSAELNIQQTPAAAGTAATAAAAGTAAATATATAAATAATAATAAAAGAAAAAGGSPTSLDISVEKEGWPSGVPLPLCWALHSKLSAEKRRAVIDAFSSECLYTSENEEKEEIKPAPPRRLKVLFCTDVAAVGVQLGSHVSLVLQVGAPKSVELYVQRAARAPRFARKLLLLSDLDGHFLYESYKAKLPLHEASAARALPLLRFNCLFAAALGGGSAAQKQPQRGPLGVGGAPLSCCQQEKGKREMHAAPNSADTACGSGGVCGNAEEMTNDSEASEEASDERYSGVQTASRVSAHDFSSSFVDFSFNWFEVKPLRASCELMYRSLLGMYVMQASRLKFERWQVPSFLNAMLQSFGVDEPPAVTKQMAARLQIIHAPGLTVDYHAASKTELLASLPSCAGFRSRIRQMETERKTPLSEVSAAFAFGENNNLNNYDDCGLLLKENTKRKDKKEANGQAQTLTPLSSTETEPDKTKEEEKSSFSLSFAPVKLYPPVSFSSWFSKTGKSSAND